MKKYFILLVISVILFSCKKEEKDDSYKYLYDKLDEFILREKNAMDAEYYFNYSKIEKDSSEIKRYDSSYKISKSIDNKLKKLDFSNRKKVYRFKDSVIKILNSPLKSSNEFEYINLNDSVFKKKIENEILNIRQTYHQLHIYRYQALKVEDVN